MSVFADVPEQPEAKRLLDVALAEGPAHAYLLHGPPGSASAPPRRRSRARCSATLVASSRARTRTSG